MSGTNIKMMLVAISQDTGKCEHGWFLLSHTHAPCTYQTRTTHTLHTHYTHTHTHTHTHTPHTHTHTRTHTHTHVHTQ